MTTTNLAPRKVPGPNAPCWCGSGAKYKKCHRDRDDAARLAGSVLRARRVLPGRISPQRTVPPEIPRPEYADGGRPGRGPARVILNDEQIARLRRACRSAAEVLREVGGLVRSGITTDEIDAATHAAYLARGGYPSTLNYHGFRKSLCTSVNEVVCHGIPDDRPLEDGDIVNLDVTIFLDGMHGDTNATFEVGEVDEDSKRLIRVTRECLELGIAAAKPGAPVNAIGRAIQAHAEKHGLGVVREYQGHGIGAYFHTDLQVPAHFDPEATMRLEPGMALTIEPMLTLGSHRVTRWKDGWTVVTVDGRRSAQFEHTCLITDDGAEVLTVC